MQKVAIIGTGISGLGAAFLLKDSYQLTVYEKNDYLGGHARTLSINPTLNIDTGFIVFNKKTYPHLVKLFTLLDIPIKNSDMSFGVSINQGQFEYGSKKISSLFAQRKNILNPSFWRMLIDIWNFNRFSKQQLANHSLSEQVTLGEYLRMLKLSNEFCNHYLIAMAAAIWSTPANKIDAFPALTFLRFFQHHGLLDIHRPIQWYTVDGGSRVYVDKIHQALLASNVAFRSGAEIIYRDQSIKIIDASGETHSYDKVIIATHSDQALALLNNPSEQEKAILGAIPYQKNTAILHTDRACMPKRITAWSSWVYLSQQTAAQQTISLSYWMNNLQSLPTSEQYFVTLNPIQRPQEALIIDEYVFEHPVFDLAAIQAQQNIQHLQGYANTYYCGAYYGYGFHEDGLASAIQVAQALGVMPPW